MFDHKWLTKDEIKSIREEYGPPYASNDLTNEVDRLLLDLTAAKALLRECAGYVEYWSEQPTRGDAHVKGVVARLKDLDARIRAVPGVEAKA